uniref:Uncharacterized protein n=1 Tax=Timema cristinae TaxID=61476 RepID=A0A7R9D9U2_TIMCR|nr:unnamed protein product [Timema cristinae]
MEPYRSIRDDIQCRERTDDKNNFVSDTAFCPSQGLTIRHSHLYPFDRFQELSEKKSDSQDDDVMAVGGRFDKLQADRSFLEKTVRMTIDELTSNQTFRRLKYIDSQVKAMKNDEDNLIYEERGNSAELNYLKNKIKEERLHRVAELRMREELIAKLKDDIQNIIVKSESKQKFVDRWESSRVEQKEMRLEQAERKLKEMDIKIKYREDMEMRVHSEVDTFLRQAVDKVEDQIQSWMVRYSREVEEKKVQLSVLKSRKQQDYRKLEELTIIVIQPALGQDEGLPGGERGKAEEAGSRDLPQPISDEDPGVVERDNGPSGFGAVQEETQGQREEGKDRSEEGEEIELWRLFEDVIFKKVTLVVDSLTDTFRGLIRSFEMERESILISSSLPNADDGKLSAAWSIKSTNTSTISTAPTDSLTQLEVVGIITVLEDCVDQLVVLGLTGNKPQYEDKTTFKSLEER